MKRPIVHAVHGQANWNTRDRELDNGGGVSDFALASPVICYENGLRLVFTVGII